MLILAPKVALMETRRQGFFSFLHAQSTVAIRKISGSLWLATSRSRWTSCWGRTWGRWTESLSRRNWPIIVGTFEETVSQVTYSALVTQVAKIWPDVNICSLKSLAGHGRRLWHFCQRKVISLDGRPGVQARFQDLFQSTCGDLVSDLQGAFLSHRIDHVVDHFVFK